MVRQAFALSPNSLRLAIFGLCVLAAVGCEGMKSFTRSEPKPQAARMVTTWKKQVQFGNNPMTSESIAGIMGRVYLFESEPNAPLTGEGTIAVDLFDESRSDGARREPIEHWDITPDILPKLLQKDAIGQGYSLSLPWSSYRPDIKRVQMQVRYTPKTGDTLVANEVLTLEHGSGAPAVRKTPPAAVAAK